MKIVVVGATGSLGRALVEQEMGSATTIHVVATDQRDLEALKAHTMMMSKARVEIHVCNFSSAQGIEGIPLDGDRYYFPIGYSHHEDVLGTSSVVAERIVNINFLAVALLINQVIEKKMKTSKLDLIGFGSIAETRGRGQNIFYSSAKRSLTSFFESLLHSAEKKNIRPFLFQIGYMKSQQSFGKRLLFPVAEPIWVARQVASRIEAEQPGIYYLPRFWFVICFALRCLPWPIYRRLQF